VLLLSDGVINDNDNICKSSQFGDISLNLATLLPSIRRGKVTAGGDLCMHGCCDCGAKKSCIQDRRPAINFPPAATSKLELHVVQNKLSFYHAQL